MLFENWRGQALRPKYSKRNQGDLYTRNVLLTHHLVEILAFILWDLQLASNNRSHQARDQSYWSKCLNVWDDKARSYALNTCTAIFISWFLNALKGSTEQLAMNDKFNTELTKKMRRKSSGNMSSASSTSSSFSCFSGESSPGMDLGSVSEVEAHLIDMAENAKQRRRGRSKSVPQIKRVRTSSTDEPIDLTVNTKMDARSFQEMPSTSLCSTELWCLEVNFSLEAFSP